MKKTSGSSKQPTHSVTQKIPSTPSIGVVLLCWLLCRGFICYWLPASMEFQNRFEDVSRWLNGQVSHEYITFMFTQGSLILSLMPRLFSQNFQSYQTIYALMMLWFDGWIIYQLWHLPRLLNHYGWKSETLYHSWICLLYIFSTFLFGPLLLQHDTLAYTALLFAAMTSLLQDKNILAVLYLSIASAIYPSLCLLAIVYPFYDKFSMKTVSKKTATLIHSMRFFAYVGGLSIALHIPYLWQLKSFFFQSMLDANRFEIKAESLLGSFHNIWQRFSMGGSFYSPSLAINNLFEINPSTWRYCLLLFQCLSCLLVTLFIYYRIGPKIQNTINFSLCFLGYFLILLTILIIAHPNHFPDQFVLIVPWMLWSILLPTKKQIAQTFSLLAMCLSLGLVIQFYYQDLYQGDTLPLLLVLASHCFMFVFLMLHSQRSSFINIWGPWNEYLSPRIYALAILSVLTWMFLANLSETTANDIFIQLRFGAEILDTWKFPTIEHYSATVSGKPFIAHEWFAGVFFELIHRCFGPSGLSFLAAWIALSCPIVLYFSSPKTLRQSFLFLPILTLASYLISFRVLVRPHLFTLLILCIFVYLLEHWRAQRNHKILWTWLPIQLIWINLHGAALFGPVFLLSLAGIYYFQSYLSLIRSSTLTTEECRLRSFDLLGIGIASACICVINPYGLHIGQFAVDLISNTYIKSRIWEWTTPFLPSNLTYYWLWLYTLWVMLIWFSIWLQLHDKPIIDGFVAALMTYMSLRANRFVPDIAIFGFPIVLRGWQQLRENYALSQLDGWKSITQLLISTLLISNTLIYGYAHSAREHRPKLGWGFGGDMPYKEVELLEKMKLEGIIFNEYSDGSLIIHRLVPRIRPVLDSRIDLYPLDIVTAYDYAYVYPQHFEQFVEKYKVNLALLHKQRSRPEIIQHLLQHPNWQHIPTGTQRLLFQRVN